MIPFKILSAKPLSGGRLKISLSNGKKGVFDVSPYFCGEFFAELKNAEYFAKVAPVPGGGGIEWPNGQDLSAHTIESGLLSATDKKAKTIASSPVSATMRPARLSAAKSFHSKNRNY